MRMLSARALSGRRLNPIPLSGHNALVTGASSGIGAACALTLARAGARVLLCGRHSDRLQAVSSEISRLVAATTSGVAQFTEDLTQEGALERAAAAANSFGGVDLLVHAAGVLHFGSFADTPLTQLDQQLAINLRVPYRLTQLLLSTLRERRGQIVFVNSSAARGGRAGVAAYAASKAALHALADALRQEVNADGIRVLSVFPGRTATPMQDQILRAEGRERDDLGLLEPADVAATILHALTLPRTAEITDLDIRPLTPPRAP